MTDPVLWRWQGFFGPMAAAVAAKLVSDADSARCGAWVPPPGQPPVPVDTSGTFGMYAVQVRPENPLPVPAGLAEAQPDLVGRLVNA